MITLYRGNNQADQAGEIKVLGGDRDLFEGVFASDSSDVAEQHGDFLYTIKIDKSDLAGNAEIRAGLKDRGLTVKNVLSDYVELDAIDEYGFDTEETAEAWSLLRSFIFEESHIEQYMYDDEEYADFFKDFLGNSDVGEAGWYVQKLRGILARAAGFKAVTMSDERVESVLVLGGFGIMMEIA